MQRSKTIELIGIYLIVGFFFGMILSIFIYSLLFNVVDERFTFDALLDMHIKQPALFLVFVLPFLAVLFSFMLAKSRIKYLKRIDKLLEDEYKQLDNTKTIIRNLTDENLDTSIGKELLNEELASCLQELQITLKNKREKARSNRQSDMQRNWTSTGLAEVGDLLRSNSSDFESLGYAVIAYLVRYLEINQGGFFITKEDEKGKYLEMIACHAYERKKFPDQMVRWGDGLIGAVAIEKKHYYTNKIPDGYLTITSGLGRANPTNLLIMPLVINEVVYGVFELACFSEIKDYQIQFVERVAENTATTLSIMYSNTRTEQLLKETQEQAAKLSRQEEELSRSLDELRKMQIEASEQSEQFISFTNTVNHTLIRAEYNDAGELTYANTRFLKAFGYSGFKEVEGKHVTSFLHPDDRQWFNPVWDRLSKGGKHYEGYMRHMQKLGVEKWIIATYTCVRNEEGGIENILFLAIDSSAQKEEEFHLKSQIKALDQLNIKVEFGPEGRFISCNDLFLKRFNYNRKELAVKNIFDFFPKSEQERFQEIWEDVITGKSYMGQLRMSSKFEEDTWVRAVLHSAVDIYGEVEKIFLIAYDINKEKELELSLIDQNERLKSVDDDARLKVIDLQKQIEDLQVKSESEIADVKAERMQLDAIILKHPNPILCINNLRFITLVNKAAEKYFSVSAKKLIRTPITGLFSESQTSKEIQSLVNKNKILSEVKNTPVEIKSSQGKVYKAVLNLLIIESRAEIIYSIILE